MAAVRRALLTKYERRVNPLPAGRGLAGASGIHHAAVEAVAPAALRAARLGLKVVLKAASVASGDVAAS